MRSVLLMFFTVIALFGAFVLYTRIAAPPARLADPLAGISDTTLPSTGAIVQGDPTVAGAWVNLYDKNARFYGRLRSAACIPTPTHLYKLQHPQAQFFQSDGRIVDLIASGGEVAMTDQPRQMGLNSAPFDSPSRGTLRDVLISLYADQAAYDRHEADMTAHLPSAQFDADADQLATADLADGAGGVTPADQIPVTVLGKDMDVYGKGLMLYWDGEAHDLKSLLVKHGDHLLLKNTSDIDARNAPPEAAKSSTAPVTDVPPVVGTPIAPAPVAVAPPAVGPVSTAAPIAASALRFYRATFTENVRVLQARKQLINADLMDVTIVHRAGSPSPTKQSAAAPPATAAQPAPAVQPSPATVALPSVPRPLPLKPDRQAAHPAPSTQPVLVYWTGPLTIKPVTDVTEALQPGQEIVRFTGSPHIHLDSLDMAGQRARYDSATGAARLVGDTDKPIILTLLKPDGKTAGTVIGNRVDLFQFPSRDLIRFTGPGVANFASPDKPDDHMRAGWSKQCDITLLVGKDQRYVQHAMLQGDALVSSGPPTGREKLRLTGDQIDADFDPPPAASATKTPNQPGGASAGPVKKVVAIGNALCVVHDEKVADRSIATDKLTIETALDVAGKPYPRFVTAEGNAHAQQEDQNLSSRRMDATIALAPSAVHATPEPQLQTLLASGNVVAHGKNEQTVQADTLNLEQRGEQQTVTIVGSPNAVVSGDNGVLRGGHIEARPKEHWAKVVGPGTIDGTTAPAPGKPPQPMHVEWTASAELNGDLVDVHGNVVAHSREQSGAMDDATADNAHLVFMPKPVDTTAKKTVVKKPAAGEADPFGNQEVKTITLLNHAAITSTLSAADHSIIHRAYISGNEIDTDNARQIFTVPGAGRMLLQDHPAPGAKAAKRTSASPEPTPTSARGTTGFWWSNQFSFDQRARQAVIDGAVIIKHLPDQSADSKAPRTDAATVLADHVVADFEKSDARASAPGVAMLNDDMKLKQLTATGHVEIKTNGSTIDATTVIDDPATQTLIATGTEDNRVRVINDKDRTDAMFREVWIDTKTNTIKKMIDFTGASRR